MRYADGGRSVEGRQVAGHGVVVPAVVVGLPPDDFFLSGVGPGDAHGQHGGFSAGGHEADLVGAGDEVVDPLAPLQHRLHRGAKVGAQGRSLSQSVHHRRVGVTQKQRGRSQPEIYVLVAVHVPFSRPLAPGDGDRERRGDVAVMAGATRGKQLLESWVQLRRLGVLAYVGFLNRLRHGSLLIGPTLGSRHLTRVYDRLNLPQIGAMRY